MSCWLLQVEFSNSHQYSWLRLKSEVTQCKCQGSPGFHLDCDVFIVLSTKMTTWTSSQVSNTTMKGESTSPVSTSLAWFCFFLHASTYLCTAAPDHHQKWKDNKNILHCSMKRQLHLLHVSYSLSCSSSHIAVPSDPYYTSTISGLLNIFNCVCMQVVKRRKHTCH